MSSSLMQAGRKQWFLWVKHSITTLKISGLCTSLSCMLFVGPWRCCSGANLQRHSGMQLSWDQNRLRWLSWALSFWVWFPPGDDAYFISCVLQLQALDKKHFLSACVISSIAKMDPGTKYTETKQGLYRTAQVCVCVHVFMCTLSL